MSSSGHCLGSNASAWKTTGYTFISEINFLGVYALGFSTRGVQQPGKSPEQNGQGRLGQRGRNNTCWTVANGTDFP